MAAAGLLPGVSACESTTEPARRPPYKTRSLEWLFARLESVHRLLEFVIRHGYSLVFFWVLAEQAALPLPSIPLLMAAGALARMGKLSLMGILLCGLLGCLLADVAWFQLGKWRGAKILRFICRISLEPDSCVRKTENLFVRFGLRSLLVAKFIPGLNAVAAPMAGASGVSMARFMAFDSLGALLWIGAYVSIGYVFTDQLEIAASYALQLGSWLIYFIAGLLAGWIGWKFIQRRRMLRELDVARITAWELQSRLRAGEDIIVLDLRSPLDQTESVPGALRFSLEELAERNAEIPRDREVVVLCT
jgi:membrane protein DedA with SNARE-associated domain